MDLQKTYRVLIVSAAEHFNTALTDLLPPSKYSMIHTVCSIHDAKDFWEAEATDFVIINTPLPDDNGADFAIAVSRSLSSVVLFLAGSEEQGEQWLLNGRLSMDEPTAHRYIEKQAMDRCISRCAVSEEILKMYS